MCSHFARHGTFRASPYPIFLSSSSSFCSILPPLHASHTGYMCFRKFPRSRSALPLPTATVSGIWVLLSLSGTPPPRLYTPLSPYLHPTEGHRHSKHHLSLGWKCPTSLGLYPTKRSALRNDRLSTTNLSCGCTPPHTLTFKS